MRTPQSARLAAASALVKELLSAQLEHEATLGGPDAADAAARAALPSDGDLGSLPKPRRVEVALRRCSPLMVGKCGVWRWRWRFSAAPLSWWEGAHGEDWTRVQGVLCGRKEHGRSGQGLVCGAEGKEVERRITAFPAVACMLLDAKSSGNSATKTWNSSKPTAMKC